MSAGSARLVLLAHTLLAAAGGWVGELPPGFPKPRVPADNPMSAAKMELGRRLFYDPRLSGNGTQSCSSCHRPELAFTDGRAHALGSTGQFHPRSAMSLANAAFSASLTWADPRVRTLERQAGVPLRNEHPVEMGLVGHEREVLARLRAEALYVDLFAKAFPAARPPITFENARKAIASFERTILSGRSRYDRFVWDEDRAAMSAGALRGMSLFFSPRLRCSQCHSGFTFSGPVTWQSGPPARPAFFDNGLAPTRSEAGLSAVTGRRRDRESFRAPTLRNVAVTGPYMHDGRFATLEAVLDHYASGGGSEGAARKSRSPLVTGFSMTQGERSDLIEFLESLTDDDFLHNPCLSDPWAPLAPPCVPGKIRTKASN
jgi:cytochrome c peroxidase